MERPELSVIVPVHNEEGNAAALAREIAAVLDGRAFEMIFVDDASADATAEELEAAKAELPQLRILQHRSNAGQSRAIRTGAKAARAPVIATLDGDGQNDPADLPDLYRLLQSGAGASPADAPAMAMGRRADRKDTAWKRMGSNLANNVRRRMLRDDCDDSGCGIKVMRRDAYLDIPFFDHMHRYMPALMRAEGHRVVFHNVNHRPRGEGRSNYTNFGRLRAAGSDMRGVMWLIRRRRDPGGVDEL